MYIHIIYEHITYYVSVCLYGIYYNHDLITDTICGGFYGPKKVYKVCRFRGLRFCKPFTYKRIGNYCHPSSCLDSIQYLNE